MRFKLLFIVLMVISLSSRSQAQVYRIEIVQPSIDQEATSIWRTINDIAFLENQGYNINLPNDPLVDSLIRKSRNGSFGNEDFPTIYALVESRVFDKGNYKQAIQKVENQIELLNNLVNEIDARKSAWDWNFQMFDTYQIIFTLYGTGGSYDPDAGTITLLTNQAGDFMNYRQPANTIIHEITHMGMEYSIVQKYNLSHGLKERLVDTFVYLMFKEELPDYKIQNMGDLELDEYVTKEEDISLLNKIISEFDSK